MKCVRKRLGDLGSKNEKFFSSLLLLHRANGFTIRIRDGNLLGARSKARGDDGERVHVLEWDGGGLPVDGDGGCALKAAAANG